MEPTLEHTVSVKGMTCKSCVNSIQLSIAERSDVNSIEVSLDDARARIFAAASVPPVVLVRAIEDVGFEAAYQYTTTSFCVQGMTDGESCVRNIQDKMLAVDGILAISVLPKEARATLRFNVERVSVQVILAHIDTMGFTGSWPYEDIDNHFDQIAKRHQTGAVREAGDTLLSAGSQSRDWDATSHNRSDTIREVDQILDSIPSSLLHSSVTACMNERCILRVSGMTCSSCTAAIEKGLKKYPGVEQVRVALLAQQAEVTFNRELISIKQIIAGLGQLGFGAEELDYATEAQGECQLRIDGMLSQADANHVEAQLSRLNGVLSARVDFLQRKAWIKVDSEVIGIRSLHKHISRLGYFPSPIDFHSQNQLGRNEASQWRRSCLLALVFFVPSMIIMTLFKNHMQWEKLWFPGISNKNFLLFLLATPVQVITGRYFYLGAYRALKHGMANMDVLVLLATNAAYFYSVLVCIVFMAARSNRSPKTFFEMSPMLMVFVSLGRWLEHKAKGKTFEAVSKLISMQSSEAILAEVVGDFSIKDERPIHIGLLERGDIVKVYPGERIPVDGKIIHGSSMVDESLITGEHLPVFKKPDSLAIAGSVNGNSPLLIKATHVAQDTTLNQIVRLVGDAQTSKAPIQLLADQLAHYFVPVVCLTAAVTFASWIAIGLHDESYIRSLHMALEHSSDTELTLLFALQCAITVLAIACPCSLGLATPTAVMVSTGVGARNGVLIKGGEPLELLQRVIEP